MTLATPLGLLALLAIPAIVAIHLFRRRFPVRPVAGLFLWQEPRQTPVEGRRVDRLPVTASLILECLAALVLALILAGARLSPAGGAAHLVVLLDDSASMAAVNASGESARDRAVRRVLSELGRLGSRARVTLVLSGERPSVLAGPSAFAVEARPALEGWAPQAASHSLALGLRMARELAGRDSRLMIVSDMTPDVRGNIEIAGGLWVAVGEPLANVGLIAAERTLSPDEGRGTVSLTLASHAGAPAPRRLTVSAAGKDVVSRDLEVPPGISSLTVPLPPGLPPVRVALSDDALVRDNSVVLAEPRPRVVGVENRLQEGRGRDALVRALDAVSGVTRAEPGHLVFVDAAGLDDPPEPGSWRVGFGNAPQAWRAAGESRDFAGPFVLEKRHPLLQGVSLGGVVWTGAAPLAPGSVHPVISAGDHRLLGLPASASRDELAVLFNLDLERTNLIRSPDWPILISNLVEMRRTSLPGPERWNYRVGEWIRVRLGRDPQGPLRYRCESVERTLAPGRDLEFLAPAPGGLLEILEGETVLFALGINFLDEAESDLRERATADVGALEDPAVLRAGSGAPADPLYWLLLAVGGAAIVGNWWILAPRRRRG